MFNLGNNSLNRQEFKGGTQAGANNAANRWETWQKPKNARFVFMYLLGAGAGGGKGLSNSSGTSRGGGGGGGAGAQVRAFFLAEHLPDILYVQTPLGGKGQDGTAAEVGGRVWISVRHSLSVFDTVMRSGDADASVGAVGTTAGGAGGGGGSILTNSNSTWCNISMFNAIFGVSGSNGGSGAAGTAGLSQTVLNYLNVAGGAGGGAVTTVNTSTAGGDQTGQGLLPSVPGGANTGEAGRNGLYIAQPFMCTGGSGGGGLDGAAGRGGDGAFGCGGGGGGGGFTGGNGGRGGDAICIISCF